MINIAFITDNNYAPVAGTAITSLKLNRDKNQDYHIYIIMIDVEDENITRFRELDDRNFQIIIRKAEEKYTKFNRNTGSFTSRATYTRLYLAEMFPELDEILYLDNDIIVQYDLSELNEINIQGCYCAASRDMDAETAVPSYLEKLHSELTYYFNAGVMKLNLKKMREDQITEKLIDYLHNGVNFGGNQDAFNVVFDDKVKYVSCIWNFLAAYLKSHSEQSIAEYYEIAGGIDFLKESNIIHFAGITKPWENYHFYLTNLFMNYYFSSPFKDLGCFEPWKQGEKKVEYLFPFDAVEKNSKIIIYGAGTVGKYYVHQIHKTGYCKIAAWVDSCFDSIGNYNIQGTEYTICSPKRIIEMGKEYDVCVIAVVYESVYLDIKSKLIAMHVPEEKIIWENPRYVITDGIL